MELSQKAATDDSAVARLHEEHGPALFVYLSYQTGSPESAEDVLVEVFVAALETDKFASWLAFLVEDMVECA